MTLSVLDKVWIISDTKTGPLSYPMERGSPYLGNISLSRALACACLFNMPGIGLSTSLVGGDYPQSKYLRTLTGA